MLIETDTGGFWFWVHSSRPCPAPAPVPVPSPVLSPVLSPVVSAAPPAPAPTSDPHAFALAPVVLASLGIAESGKSDVGSKLTDGRRRCWWWRRRDRGDANGGESESLECRDCGLSPGACPKRPAGDWSVRTWPLVIHVPNTSSHCSSAATPRPSIHGSPVASLAPATGAEHTYRAHRPFSSEAAVNWYGDQPRGRAPLASAPSASSDPSHDL